MEANLIISIVNSIAIPILSGAFFYTSRKRKEAAIASQEESRAVATAADGWKNLCEKRDEDVRKKEDEIKAKDVKIDSLYDKINDLRDNISILESKNHELIMLNQELEWNRCEVNGCQKRKPPRDRENLRKLGDLLDYKQPFKLEDNEMYTDRSD